MMHVRVRKFPVACARPVSWRKKCATHGSRVPLRCRVKASRSNSSSMIELSRSMARMPDRFSVRAGRNTRSRAFAPGESSKRTLPFEPRQARLPASRQFASRMRLEHVALMYATAPSAGRRARTLVCSITTKIADSKSWPPRYFVSARPSTQQRNETHAQAQIGISRERHRFAA